MPYVPINVNTYVAAYSGALASIAASGKVPSPNDEPQIATAVQLWAQAFDTAWGALGLNTFSQQAIFNLSAAVWQTRAPMASVTLVQYSAIVSALMAEIVAANLNFTAQGITPPAIPVTSLPTLLQTVSTILAADVLVRDLTPIVSVPITTSAGTKLIITFSCAGVATANDQLVSSLLIDGVVVPHSYRSTGYDGASRYGGTTLAIEVSGLAAGPHTVTVQGATFTDVNSILIWPLTFPTLFGASMVVQEVTV